MPWADRIGIAFVWLWLLGYPVNIGYFYNRPFCGERTPDRVACSATVSVIWPVVLPANLSVRVFEK